MSDQEPEAEPCEHPDFMAQVEVNRLSVEEGGPLSGYSASVRVWCVHCNEPFVFHGYGLPVGIRPDRPTLSATGEEVHLPLRPQSSDPAFGLGMPGFAMRVEGGNEHGLN